MPEYDLVFVDANKKAYRAYYDLLLTENWVRRSGMIVFDNILYSGFVYDERTRDRPIPKALNSFTRHVMTVNKRAFILPAYDGLLMAPVVN